MDPHADDKSTYSQGQFATDYPCPLPRPHASPPATRLTAAVRGSCSQVMTTICACPTPYERFIFFLCHSSDASHSPSPACVPCPFGPPGRLSVVRKHHLYSAAAPTCPDRAGDGCEICSPVPNTPFRIPLATHPAVHLWLGRRDRTATPPTLGTRQPRAGTPMSMGARDARLRTHTPAAAAA